MNTTKRLLALMLALCMMLSVVPFSAFASESADVTEEPTAVTVDASEGGETPADVPTEDPVVEPSTEAPAEDPTVEVTPEEPSVEETPAEDPVTDETPAEEPVTDETVPATEETEPVIVIEEATASDDIHSSDVIEEATATAVEPALMTATLASDYRILHLDCGRKYFTADWIKALINEMADAGYTHLELAFGNDGLRFLLDDMSVTVGETTYSSADVTAAIQAANKAYYDAGDKNELTQAEMDSIIAHANTKGIQIIPLLNTPGHMNAIVSALKTLGVENPGYDGSANTIDITNTTAVEFTKALVQKYVTYFAGKDCNEFNMGADEYANDVYSTGGMGFAQLVSAGLYDDFANYVQQIANIIKNADMVPMAFNDGIYYGNTTDGVSFDKNILVCYWTCGWSGYNVATTSTLTGQGFKMINTNGDFYYILGKDDSFDSGYEKAKEFDKTAFIGNNTVSNSAGSMFCIWCDYPNAETETVVAQKILYPLRAMALAMQDKTITSDIESIEVAYGFNADGTINDGTVTQKVSCEDFGITVTARGLTGFLTGLTCEEVAEPAYIATGDEVVVGYNITPTTADGNYSGEAQVTIKLHSNLENCTNIFVYDALVQKLVEDVTVENGFVTFAVTHFSEYDVGGTPRNTNVVNTETITVSVGGTTTVTISDVNLAGEYATGDASIATVSVTGTDGQESVDTYTTVSNNPRWTSFSASSTPVATDYYYQADDGYHQLYVSVDSQNKTGIFGNTFEGIRNYTLGYYANDSFVTAITGKIERDYIISEWPTTRVSGTLYTKSGTEAVPASTTITFSGHQVGITSVVVGTTEYTINVVAEDLTNVDPLTIEYWITNARVQDTAGNQQMSVSASDAYGEGGVLVSDLVPETGIKTGEGYTTAYWKTTRLASDNKQTTGGGVDKTKSGDDFTYIRYYGGSWSYSADGQSWTNFVSGDQIVAYYLQVTQVTNEVVTQVVDYGIVREDWSDLSYLGTSYVLLDYSVKYESGEEVPSTFPTAKTMGFHCVDSNGAIQYRTLGMIRAVETTDYEVYMITVTPTEDAWNSLLSGTTVAGNTSYSYNGTERVVWAATQEDLENSGLGTYTSISGAFTYSIGGDAIVPGLEIYRQHGMKVTYYVRAKVTEDSLTVRYFDETSGTAQQFYTYNIAVASGTTFDPNIKRNETNWKGPLDNGTVTNILGNDQTVSADLSSMPAIGAQYRNSEYTCTRVEIDETKKIVSLYYTFENYHVFVVDFGLPVKIDFTQLQITGTWTSGTVTSLEYGTVDVNAAENTLTYTPTRMLQGVEGFTLTLTNAAGDTLTHQVYIAPATTVYYEEGFATYNGSWTDTGSKGTKNQTTQVAGSSTDNYGFDNAYVGYVDASNGTEATSSNKGDKATFTFTGKGVDIYANCTTGTGWLMIKVDNASTGATVSIQTVKMLQVNTALNNGTTNATQGQAVEGYNVPVASITDLTHGTYTVTIANVSGTVNLDGYRIYNTLATEPTFYTTDMEDKPVFIELRNHVLDSLGVADPYTGSQYANQIAASIHAQVYASAGTTDGVVITASSGQYDEDQILDLLDNGPKNEIYLMKDQSLTFTINTSREVQIGLKALNAATSYTVNNGTEVTLNSSTDMFYTLQNRGATTRQTYTITNTGNGILSITKLKVCDDPNAALGTLTAEDLIPAMLSLGYEMSPDGSTDTEEPVTPVEPEQPEEPEVPEVVYADAGLTVSLVDYTGAQLASAQLTANGVEGETKAFTAAEVLAAAAANMPAGYVLVDEASVSGAEVAYGETGTVTVQIGKTATLKVVYVNLFGRTVGSATFTGVQTSAGSCQFSAAQVRGSAPAGRRAVWLSSVRVTYGAQKTIIVPTI